MTQGENGTLKRIEEKMDKVIRGMYGDPENKYRGLIERQEEDERLRKDYITKRQLKIWVIGVGVWIKATLVFLGYKLGWIDEIIK